MLIQAVMSPLIFRGAARGTVGTVCTVPDFCHQMLFIVKCVLGSHINSHADNFTKNISILFEDVQVNEHFNAFFHDKSHRNIFHHLPTDVMLCRASFFLRLSHHDR